MLSRFLQEERNAILIICGGVLICLFILYVKSDAQHPDIYDARQYLAAAYNLYHHGVFSEGVGPGEPDPGLGREPTYSAVLAILMKLDPGLARVSPACLFSQSGCEPGYYTIAIWLNRLFIAMSGLIMFLVARMITGKVLAGAIAGGHIWLNVHMLKGQDYIISDPLALMLVALLSLTVLWAIKRRGNWPWIIPALVLALLTLTKAIFLYFAIVSIVIALVLLIVNRDHRQKIFVPLILFTCVYTVPVSGWMYRNLQVGGEFAITVERSGIALNTREVLNHMTTTQYIAALFYWTRGFGDSLAKAIFDEATLARFDVSNPDGFYLQGHLGYAHEVTSVMEQQGVNRSQGRDIVDARIKKRILDNLPVHILTTFPVFYRGIWIDLFILFSFPCLVYFSWIAMRNRRWDIILVLWPGLFSLFFYALISLNLPRYQMTAIPALSLATALGVVSLLKRYKRQKKL